MQRRITVSITCLMCELLLITMAPIESSSLHDIWHNIFNVGQYNMNVRPVRNETTVTAINISLALVSVIDFSEVKQTITLATKMTLVWVDEFLTWEASNFSGVEHVHVYQKDIWKPSIFLENSVSKQKDFGSPYLHVLVRNDGEVEWLTLEVFETTCMTDVTQFPFDEQSCSLIFEPFGYMDNEIKVMAASDHFEIHSYGGASGWTIVRTELETVEEEEGVHVIAEITLRRNPIYMVLNIMLPIACLSLLNNCVFLLPVESGEKASFAVTVFLALAVFLTIVSQQLPENSDHASFLNIYVILNALASVIIAILTLVQIRIFHRDPNLKVPNFLARVALRCSSKQRIVVQAKDHENSAFKPVTKISNGKTNPNGDDDDGKTDTDKTSAFDHNVTWKELVKALDNILFICFMFIFMTTTLGLLLTMICGKFNRYAESHSSGKDH